MTDTEKKESETMEERAEKWFEENIADDELCEPVDLAVFARSQVSRAIREREEEILKLIESQEPMNIETHPNYGYLHWIKLKEIIKGAQ